MQLANQYLLNGDDMLRIEALPLEPHGQIEPTIKLVWQPTEAAVQKLAEAEAIDAQLLVIVEQEGDESERKLFPLDWRQAYVVIRNPGISTLHTTIVWSDDPKDRGAKRLFDRDSRDVNYVYSTLQSGRPSEVKVLAQIEEVEHRLYYEITDEQQVQALQKQLERLESERIRIMREEEYQWYLRPNMFSNNPHSTGHQLGYATDKVIVPAGMFATNWRITEKLGYLIWKEPANDNCELRRRAGISAVLAVTWIPLKFAAAVVWAALFYLIAAGIVVGAHLMGYRNLDYSCFRWNDPSDLKDITSHHQPSRWTMRQTETMVNGYPEKVFVPRAPMFYIINPPVGLVFAALVVVLWLNGFGWSLAVLLGVVALAMSILGMLFSVRFESRRPQGEAREIKRTATIQNKIKERYSYSAVDARKESHMPPLVLFYQETKARLCRPFPQRR